MKFSTSGFNENERNFFAEIVFVMQTYFFVYVGINLQFGSVFIYGIALLIVIILIASRPLSIKLFAGKNIPGNELAIMSIMTPKGLVAAVLASIPMQQNLAYGDKIMDLGYSIVLLSIVICSVLVIILSKDPLFIKKVVSRKRNESAVESGIESKQIK